MDRKRDHGSSPVSGIERPLKQRKAAGVDVSGYLLSADQMREHKFPLPDSRPHSGWIQLDAGLDLPETHDIMAVDCEMCVTTGPYKELTRVVVLDSEGAVVLDKLVKPQFRVTDYRTQYSGITAESLAGVKTTLSDVQSDLKRLISSRTTLVGHSLENDLRALRLVHLRVVDTSVMYYDPVRKKFPLKELARQHLKRQIQQGPSHDPIEDARTALHLAYLKMDVAFTDSAPAAATSSEPTGDELGPAELVSLTAVDVDPSRT